MNALQDFSFEGRQVRMVTIDDQPMFVGKDVANILGYSETAAMTRRLEDEDFMSAKLAGMNMKSTLINEAGLYSAVLGSHLESAHRFKHWVTHDVLPSIREQGMYMEPAKVEQLLSNPDTMIEVLTRYKESEAERRRLHDENEIMKPKALFADAVSESERNILVGELAKVIKQNGIAIGQNRLFRWLRDHDYLIKRKGTDWNMPTQKSMELGLFRIKETSIAHSDGHVTVQKTAKVTGRGQQYFINKFLSADELAE